MLIHAKDVSDPALNVKETYPIAVDPSDFSHWKEVKFTYPLSKLEIDGFKDLTSNDVETVMGFCSCLYGLSHGKINFK